MTKAIALLSGGLDSILATRLIMDHGIEVEAVNFATVFCTCTAKNEDCLVSKKAADNLGVKLKIFEISKEFFEIIKNPKHGYGSNMNPCIDCRIFILKRAAEYMKKVGASFLFTGEVLGERPMSQRRDALRIIERDSNLEGMILRPLSAKVLEPTVPEKEGLVDREKLLSITGRSRKPQIELARKFGINDYPRPAGGCLLTDPGFARRMRDLIKHKPNFNITDIQLLKTGRYFRLSPEATLLVGRNENENNKLMSLAGEKDISFYPNKVMGPTGIGNGVFTGKEITSASSIIARYSDGDSKIEVSYKRGKDGTESITESLPASEEELKNLRI